MIHLSDGIDGLSNQSLHIRAEVLILQDYSRSPKWATLYAGTYVRRGTYMYITPKLGGACRPVPEARSKHCHPYCSSISIRIFRQSALNLTALLVTAAHYAFHKLYCALCTDLGGIRKSGRYAPLHCKKALLFFLSTGVLG